MADFDDGQDARANDERARAELARKLNLLMDVIVAADGKPASYKQIAAFLEARGLHLSRARWVYMLSGSRVLVTDEAILSAIADYFEVPASYLVGGDDGEIPARVEAALQFVRAERLSAVRLFAARKLGEVSPETLEKLTAILDEASGDAREDRGRSSLALPDDQ